MGRKNLLQTVQQCEMCSFSSKNWYIYKRHRIRCRKEHGITKGKKTDGGAATTRDRPTPANGMGSNPDDTHESGPELSSSESPGASCDGTTPGSQPNSGGKARPSINRNYHCTKCGLRTNRSRVYLYHLVEEHGSSTDIYACRQCEYCCRYRHKVQRHMKVLHQLDLPQEVIFPEHVNEERRKAAEAQKAAAARKIKLPVGKTSKRKLTVKFSSSRGGGGAKSPESSNKGNKSPSGKVPAIRSAMLSRVVEEFVGEDGSIEYKCKKCPFESEDKQKVAKHMVSWHVDIKHFNCTTCGYICFEQQEFFQHRMTHRNVHKYKCDACSYSTDFRPNYDRHQVNHQGVFPYKCPHCTYGCASDSAIKRHVALNHDSEPAPAPVEDLPKKQLRMPVPKPSASLTSPPGEAKEAEGLGTKVAPSSKNKQESSASTSGSKPKKFPAPMTVSRESTPESIPAKFFFDDSSATMVPRRTLPPPTLSSDVLNNREMSPLRKLPPNITSFVKKDEKDRLVCPACNHKGYKRSSDLNRHMKRKHNCRLRDYLESMPDSEMMLDSSVASMGDTAGELSDAELTGEGSKEGASREVSEGEDDNMYEEFVEEELYDACEAALSSPGGRQGVEEDETAAVHPSQLKCRYCQFEARLPSELRRHLSVHAIEKRYTCNFCPKKYKYIGDMNLHIRKDHNKVPSDVKIVRVATVPRKKTCPAKFKCPCCSYTSAWKSEVDRHSRLHTGEKTFQCSQCDYQTYWRGDARRHVYKHHPEMMTEGVNVEDVVIFRKDRTPELVGGTSTTEAKAVGTGASTSSFKPIREHTPESSPEKQELMDVSPMEVNMDATLPKSEHSPTPSPIKEIGGGLYRCQYCGFEANAPSKINSHLESHTNLKKYMCPLCGRRANWKWDISKHIRKDHGDEESKVIKLTTAEAEASIQAYMEANPIVKREHHLNLSQEKASTPEPPPYPHYFRCSACEYVAEKRVSVIKHIRIKHPRETVQVVQEKGKLITSQDKTRDKTPEKIQEKSRSSKEVGNKNTSSAQPDSLTPTKATDQSTVSPSTTSTPIDTLTPTKFAHLVDTSTPGDALKPFMCSECGKRGASKGDVKRHFHYVHPDKEIRIIYLGDGSQNVPQTKLESAQAKSGKPGPTILQQPQIPPPTTSPRKSEVLSIVNPKVLGYIKPFKCSVCGRRSNWRWDLNKHIREKHPGEGGHLIEMNAEEARASYEDYQAEELPHLNKTAGSVPRKRHGSDTDTDEPVEKLSKTDDESVLGSFYTSSSSVTVSPSSTAGSISSVISAAARKKPISDYTDTAYSDSATNNTPTIQQSPILIASSSSTTPSEITNSPASTVTNSSSTAPTYNKKMLRHLKCSLCPYRSSYKTDIQRHQNRRHGVGRGKIITLDKSVAAATIGSYSYDRTMGNNSRVEETSLPAPVVQPEPKVERNIFESARQFSNPAPLPKKIWKCALCPFMSVDRADALKHIGGHNMRAYRCVACNWTSNYRSAVRKHIKNKHAGDETAVCRLSIKLLPTPPHWLNQSPQSVPVEQVETIGSASVSSPTAPGNLAEYQSNQGMDLESTVQPMPENGELRDPSLTAIFCCKLCAFRSRWRSCVCRHIREHHKTTTYIKYISKKITKAVDMNGRLGLLSPTAIKEVAPTQNVLASLAPAFSKSPSSSADLEKIKKRPRNFRCTICPYKASKSKYIRFHMACHQPQPGIKQMKCKYCPYYVNKNRLLTQHTALHTQENRAAEQPINDVMVSPDGRFSYPTTPVKVNYQGHSPSPGGGNKRHRCEKCPYTTNSKNDYLYHKQFHRPKPTADYKCDFCDYWVTHRRLIKQHMKVHGVDQSFTHPSPVATPNPTPTKSEYSENSLMYDTIEIAAIKQRIIASKITPSISQTPLISPMKIVSSCSLGGKRGFMRKDGTYRKIHKCRYCPYMNMRLRNMKLHELMHGKRSATHPLMKCLHCDYFVGSKGLLAHHLKVHQPDYGVEFTVNDNKGEENGSEDSEVEPAQLPMQNKVDTLLEIARFKKYGCEKCPYASSKRTRFQKHVELHGSRQKYKCDYCDYSVPTGVLLRQHAKLHLEPNQNLLAAQSILNLQYLPEMPADVALASMLTNQDARHPVSVTHDHIDLYENTTEDAEPKKIYRCDRCPYANIRRDHLLAHLRCHMIKNTFSCPYCDYSVGKIHVLMQHVKMHFNPLPELSEWLSDNGDAERIREIKEKDLQEAIQLAKLFQTDIQFAKPENGAGTSTAPEDGKPAAPRNGENGVDTVGAQKDKTDNNKENKDHDNVDLSQKKDSGKVEASVKDENKEAASDVTMATKKEATEDMKTDGTVDNDGDVVIKAEAMDVDKKDTALTLAVNGETTGETEGYVCQYCDRDFPSSDLLVRHEMQHLIGNSYEELVVQLVNTSPKVKAEEPVAGPSGIQGNGSAGIHGNGAAGIHGNSVVGVEDEDEVVLISDGTNSQADCKDDDDDADTLKLSNSSEDGEEPMQIA